MRKIIEALTDSSLNTIRIKLDVDGIYVQSTGYKNCLSHYGSNGDASIYVKYLWEYIVTKDNAEASEMYMNTPVRADIYIDNDRLSISFASDTGAIIYSRETRLDLDVIMKLIGMWGGD